MTNYELCKHYLEQNEEIMNCVGECSDVFCIYQSLTLLDQIINKIDTDKLSMVAGTRFDESYKSIDILYRNHVIDNDDFEKLSLQLLNQIIKDMQIYVNYKDEQMKEGE